MIEMATVLHDAKVAVSLLFILTSNYFLVLILLSLFIVLLLLLYLTLCYPVSP